MKRRRVAGGWVAALIFAAVSAGTAAAGGGIRSQDLREWLSYIASDSLQGRAVFTAGYGLAAGYVQDHLRSWNVEPAGDPGSYLQTVRVLGVKTTSRSSLTVEVNGEARTFVEGAGIALPRNMGAKRHFTVDRVEFAGYGLDAAGAGRLDFRDKDVKGAAVVWLGTNGPKGLDQALYRRLLTGRGRYVTEQLGAAASLGPEAASRGARGDSAIGGPARTGGGRGPQFPVTDFTTVQRLDVPQPPNVSATDAVFEFLFRNAPTTYDELKRRAEAAEPLPSFRLSGVKLTFNIDADYQVVRTQLTQNVVGVIRGSDPQLSASYVAFGAHLDHVGYSEGEVAAADPEGRRPGAPGRITPGTDGDRIWNGADDDGSGTVALMALAKAFADGPKPKRSLVFVWHAGEERGLWGSKYFADYPTVPIDRIVAQLNIDMIGRNRDDKASEANTVYLVGSDRISSELHALNRAANDDLTRPLTLSYELNDTADTEQFYYRSDHYSYAAKGIPIIFFTTGLHPDYHANTDELSKIEFEKMTRITQLVYETGRRLANLDHAPVRDNKGPRAGRLTR